MKIKATCVLTRIYEVNRDHYPDGCTDKEVLEIDRATAEDDIDLFFSDCDDIKIDVVEIEEGDAE